MRMLCKRRGYLDEKVRIQMLLSNSTTLKVNTGNSDSELRGTIHPSFSSGIRFVHVAQVAPHASSPGVPDRRIRWPVSMVGATENIAVNAES